MGKRINLMGQKFNRLTVIEDTDLKDSCNKRLWKCLCDCGNITYATTTQLKTNHIKSCGCSHIDAMKRAAKVSAQKRTGVIKKDLTGMKFGELTVVKLDKDRMKRIRDNNRIPGSY